MSEAGSQSASVCLHKRTGSLDLDSFSEITPLIWTALMREPLRDTGQNTLVSRWLICEGGTALSGPDPGAATANQRAAERKENICDTLMCDVKATCCTVHNEPDWGRGGGGGGVMVGGRGLCSALFVPAHT